MNKQPTLQQWRRLHEGAIALKELQPWTYMEETDIFGICEPESGITGFCCVIGGGGEISGLIVYRGKSGLESYEKLLRSKNYDQMIDIQDCLSILFVRDYELQPEDIEVMERIGIATKATDIYPQFRDHIPFYIPWFLTQEAASFLIPVLDEAINICLRFKENKTLLKPHKKGQFFLRMPVKTADGIEWEDRWISSEDIPDEEEPNFVIDEVTLRRVKKKCKPADMIWEMGFFYTQDLIVNDPEKNRPCIPFHLLIVDKESGFIFGNALATPKRFHQKFFYSLVESFETHGFIPREIHIKDPELLIILKPLEAELGISVRVVKGMKSFNLAKTSLLRFLKKMTDPSM